MSHFALFMLAICAGQIDCHASSEKNNNETAAQPIGKRIEQFIRADDTSSLDAVDSSSELFGPASVAELESLRVHPNDRVAVRSAWELVCRDLTTASDGPKDDAAIHIGEFIGFVEGRLRVQVPQEWKDAILGVNVSVSDYGYVSTFPKLRLSQVYDLVSENPRCFATKGSTVTRRSDEEIEISHPSGARYVVDPVNLDPSHYRISAVSLARTDTATIVAESLSDFVSSYQLIIIADRDNVPLRVEKRDGGIGGGSGIHYHWIILVPASDYVFVFGAGSTAAYIHKVSLNGGSLEFSFTTAY